MIDPLSNPQEATAVIFAGGSAPGSQRPPVSLTGVRNTDAATSLPPRAARSGRGDLRPGAAAYPPTAGPVPEHGYAACEAAAAGGPARGSVGAGRGAAVAKILGREAGTAAESAMPPRTGEGETVAALAVVNATGDVLGPRRLVLAGPRAGDGRMIRSAEAIAASDSTAARCRAIGRTRRWSA